jgi:hypothetical protein
MLILFIYLFQIYRSETPPNTPQRARAASRQNERDNRNMDSPQHRRTPHHLGPAPIPPLQYNNLPNPQPLLLPRNPIIADDPFGPPALNVSLNSLSEMLSLINIAKQQYNNLPAHIAQQLADLPPLPVFRGRGRGRGHHPQHAPVSTVCHSLFFKSLYGM